MVLLRDEEKAKTLAELMGSGLHRNCQTDVRLVNTLTIRDEWSMTKTCSVPVPQRILERR